MYAARRLAICLLGMSYWACSLQDFSDLQNGEAGLAGASSRGGETARGGGSGASGYTGTGQGGSNGGGSFALGGATSGGAAAGGVSATNGGGSGGAGTGGITATAPPNPMGPWEFNSAAEVAADWRRDQAKVVVDWVAEGQAEPLGAMRIDPGSNTNGSANHVFVDKPNLAHYVVRAVVRAESGSSQAQFFYNDTNYVRRTNPATEIDATWTMLEWEILGDVAVANSLAVTNLTSTPIWVDRVWLTAPAGSSGAAGAAGAGSAGAASSLTQGGTSGT